MFEDLIRQVLPNLGGSLKTALLKQLKGVGKGIVAAEVSKQVARALLKGIDTFVAITVANLPRDDAEKLTGAYVVELQRQLTQLTASISEYVPLQVDVEVSKQQHGATSPQAQAARKRREAGIADLRAEVRDVLRAATGDKPED